MKKFEGIVNGKSFDNEQDFRDAVNKALEENSNDITISSRYVYVDDEKEELPAVVEEKKENILDEKEYVISEQKPLSIGNRLAYIVSTDLINKLKSADNKEDIKKNVQELRDQLDEEVKKKEEISEELQREIESLQDELYEVEDSIKDINARRLYYKTLTDIVNDKRKYEKPELRKSLGEIYPSDLFTFMRLINFF